MVVWFLQFVYLRVCKADSEPVDLCKQWAHQSLWIQEPGPEVCSKIRWLQVSFLPSFKVNLKPCTSVKSSKNVSLYSQQDAQEFLRFLLDGLHNEVNRVTVRPKVSVLDFDHLA